MPENNVNNTYSGLRLPYSPEAEQAVLGAILMDAEVLPRVTEILPSSEYFYIATHRTVYSVMMRLFTEGRPVDFVTVLEELKRDPSFDEATGKTYLIQMAQSCPAISNIESYAYLVRDKHDVRALIVAANEIIEDSADGELEPGMLIDSAEQKIYDIRRGKDIQGLQRIDEVLFQTFDRLDMLSRDDDTVKPVSTGIGELDSVITGLNRSDLILLAARPGMGKTSFALNIARNVAAAKKTVAFFSLEMTKEQLASRLLSAEALVGGTKLRTGRLSPEEWKRLIGAGDVLKNTELYLDDTPGITVPEIKAKLRRLHGVDLVVIDYLQLMSTGRRNDNRVQEISEITRNLKILAKEINVPVICLSQLSRASEQRQDHRPQLSDLRDSGSIEQDADIVLFLYREGYYDREKGAETVNAAVDQNSGECIVAKNRHGETTKVKLHWQGEFMRFTGVESHREG